MTVCCCFTTLRLATQSAVCNWYATVHVSRSRDIETSTRTPPHSSHLFYSERHHFETLSLKLFLGGRVALHQHWRYLSKKESSLIVNCSPSISDARSMLNDKHLWSGLNVGRAACSEIEVEPGTIIRLCLVVVSFLTWQSPFPWSTCRCSCGRSSRGQWSNKESRSHPLLRWRCLAVPAFAVLRATLIIAREGFEKPRYKTKFLHVRIIRHLAQETSHSEPEDPVDVEESNNKKNKK